MVNNFDYLIESKTSELSLIKKEIDRYKKDIENLESKLYAKPMTDYFEFRREAIAWIKKNKVLDATNSLAECKRIKKKISWFAKEETRLFNLAKKPIDTIAICNEISSIRSILERRNREFYFAERELENLKKPENFISL
jgi:hypothetical protein